MEINIEEQTTKLQTEVAQLTGQLQQLDSQYQQTRNNLVGEILKKQGALELLQGMEKDEPL